jgi:DNA-binding NtrC family response regulator
MNKVPLLLADDDSDVRGLLVRELRADFEVMPAASLRDALRVLAARGDVAVVVTDLCMETTTAGIVLLEAARRANPRCVRVLVSGSIGLELATRLLDEEVAHRIIEKPWSNGEVGAAVRATLEDGERLGAARCGAPVDARYLSR